MDDIVLTFVQTRISDRVSEGWTNQQIADGYNLSEGTIRNHLTAIYRKCHFPKNHNRRVLLTVLITTLKLTNNWANFR